VDSWVVCCGLWAVGCGLWDEGCGCGCAGDEDGGTGQSSVGYTRGEGSKPRLWNLQNLCPVPP